MVRCCSNAANHVCSHTRSGYPSRGFRLESLPVELEVTACAADNAPTHTAVVMCVIVGKRVAGKVKTIIYIKTTLAVTYK